MSESLLLHGKVNRDNLMGEAQELQFCLAMIEQLKGGMYARAPIQELSEIVSALINGIPFIAYSIPDKYLIYRGRIDNKVKHFNNTGDYSYKPIKISKEYGRCHKPGQTIFYGSSNIDTVLSELTPEVGDNVHIGIATPKKNINCNVTAIGEIEHCRRFRRPFIGNNQTYQILNKLLSEMPEERKTRTLVVDAFFSEVFSNICIKQRDYKVTSCQSNEIIGTEIGPDKIQLDGFGYPSVAHRGGENYAISPEAFDQKFNWVKFIAVEIVQYLGFGIYAYKQQATSEEFDENGNIIWKDENAN